MGIENKFDPGLLEEQCGGDSFDTLDERDYHRVEGAAPEVQGPRSVPTGSEAETSTSSYAGGGPPTDTNSEIVRQARYERERHLQPIRRFIDIVGPKRVEAMEAERRQSLAASGRLGKSVGLFSSSVFRRMID